MNRRRVRAPTPSPHERLSHLLVLVGVAYGVIILGVRFAPPRVPPSTTRSVRVTVVALAARAAPRRAIVLAQANARGAGRVPRDLASEEPLPSGGVPSPGRTRANAAHDRLPRQGSGPGHGRVRRGGKIAFLTARRNAGRRAPAATRGRRGAGLRLTVAHLVLPDATDQPPVRSLGRPARPAGAGRNKGWPSVSAHAARYALYLALWKRRVEAVGDRLLARLAKRRLRGQLRLEVKLARNGTVVAVSFLRPSRQAWLNTLALRILHRAEPFPPVPPGVLGKQHHLRFVYLWRFTGGGNRLGG